jgi:hypothetical protein
MAMGYGGLVSELFRPREADSRSRGRRLFDVGLAPQDLTAHSVAPQQTPGVRTVGQRPRHSGLFEAIRRMDLQIDEAARRELAAWIGEQYARDHGDIPLGFLATCYLGAPYVDHRLDLIHSIVEHFQPADAVPTPFDRARPLARLSSYEFIEVYASGVLVPVRVDGSVDIPIGGPQ